ncbi:hypothetical protein ABT324_30865 [Saccharopolyspora sp. NPDC000359]|uniref:hypothetical protein n=1 Tax=Saccharopolyspora sp. NPDC000359 TaxID=3154251 RepID=UPI00331CFF7B
MTRTDIDDYGRRGRRRVTIDRQVFEDLTRQAAAYRDLVAAIGEVDQLVALLIDCPGARELMMQEYADWLARRSASETGTAISRELGGQSFGLSQAVLQRRRETPGDQHAEFTHRHGREYQGGPVEWSTGRPADAAARVA